MPISNELSDRNFVTKIARYHRVVDGVCVCVCVLCTCVYVCVYVCVGGGGEGLEVNLAAWLCLGFCRVLICLRYAVSNSIAVCCVKLHGRPHPHAHDNVCGRVWACMGVWVCERECTFMYVCVVCVCVRARMHICIYTYIRTNNVI